MPKSTMDFPDHTMKRDLKVINDGHRYQYTVEQYSEGALSTILLGKASFNTDKLSALINKNAQAGYRMIFQVKEQRRMFIFWKRESIIMTFERALS